jgi:predicted MFS family arabinose efflux permease
VVVGRLLDRVALKPLYLGIVALQIPLLVLAALAEGWWLLGLLLAVMVVIFGSIPFTDAMIVRYVDDRMRSRVAGARLTLSIGISSLAVWLLGPLVKAWSFGALFIGMALVACATLAVVTWLPREDAAPRQG